jgi:CO/xanthine dehydrogenase FAD-binding subunit
LRNVATIGGNLCSMHPAADLVVALLASDARCVVADIVAGPAGMPVDEFLRLVTSRDPRILLTAVEIPITPVSISYQKMQTRRAFEMALVSVGVGLQIDRGAIRHARIALGGSAPSAVRASNAEAMLHSKPADEEIARAAARIAAEQDTRAEDDLHASAEYRRHLVSVLCERALREAFARPRGVAN